MYNYPYPLQKLINEVSKLPGVGPKMAERISLYILKRGQTFSETFSAALLGIKDIGWCKKCFNVSSEPICEICADTERNASLLCVVEGPEDVITVERTGKYNGYYAVLHGLVNPLNNVLPENLKIRETAEKANLTSKVKEIILAINHTVEGDATCLYVADAVRQINTSVKISRLAKGLPSGSDIKYADEATLGQAIIERKEI
ncbi:MAG: recombination mediator RecR [bacterium]